MADPRETSGREGPDFVGVGAARCGTTWLAAALAAHPGVLMPEKELNFFGRHHHRGWRWYESRFRDRGERLAGEFSPGYLITPRPDPAHREVYPRYNPRRELVFWRRRPSARIELSRRYPGVRTFALFRDPAARAWSAYWYWRRRRERGGKRIVPFERMWEDDGRWIRTWGLFGRYAREWRETFPDFGIFFHDDLVADPRSFVRSVFRFLGLDDEFVPPPAAARNASRPPHPMPAELRARAIDFYREDLGILEALTGRDLSAWREPA